MKGLFTIGAERRFADELARVVLAEYSGDPLALADVLILLPTRRSVRVWTIRPTSASNANAAQWS